MDVLWGVLANLTVDDDSFNSAKTWVYRRSGRKVNLISEYSFTMWKGVNLDEVSIYFMAVKTRRSCHFVWP